MTKDITIFDIVTDPFLHSVLDVSALTQEQCLKLSDLAASTERPSRAELAKQQKWLHAYISQLRTLNFEAILRVRQSKQATADARQEVDRLYLQLQNLDYQQLYLRMEIAACEAYEYVLISKIFHSSQRGDGDIYSCMESVTNTNISPWRPSRSLCNDIPSWPRRMRMR